MTALKKGKRPAHMMPPGPPRKERQERMRNEKKSKKPTKREKRHSTPVQGTTLDQS